MAAQTLDRVFQALADPTRRAIVERLASGAASITDLAAPFEFTLTAIGQHVQVLETSGLVKTQKSGRVRSVELRPAALSPAEQWFAQHRRRWEERLDRLGALLDDEDDSARPSTARKRKPS